MGIKPFMIFLAWVVYAKVTSYVGNNTVICYRKLVIKPQSTRAVILVYWRVLFQYPIRRLVIKSREISKPRDLYLELSDRSEISQALRQHCRRCACQISKRYKHFDKRSRAFESLRDLTISSDTEVLVYCEQLIYAVLIVLFQMQGWFIISKWPCMTS